ncbi:MAG: MFS transporter [Bacteroidales bacterium]|jgi:MFS family permease
MTNGFKKDWQYYKFCLYGFLKNQRFFEPFILLIFLQNKDLSYTQIGALYSIRFILRTLFEIPSGIAADAIGRRVTMLFSYAFYMASFLGYFFADSFLWLIFPTVLFALGDAFRTGTHKAMIFEYLKSQGWQDQKIDYYGHTRSWSQSGSAISSLIAACLVLLSKNYNAVFLYSFIPYSIGFALLASYPKFLDGKTKNKDVKLRDAFTGIISSSYRSMSRLANLRLTLNVAIFSGFYHASKDYLQILISSMAVTMPLALTPDLSEKETTIIRIGVIYFVLYFLTAYASKNTGKLNSLFQSTGRYLNVSLVAGLLTGIAAGVFFRSDLTAIAVIFFIFILVIENFRRPAGVATIAGQFEEKILASVLSAESQISSVTGAILSFGIGVIADLAGPGLAIMIMCMILLLLFPFVRLSTK